MPSSDRHSAQAPTGATVTESTDTGAPPSVSVNRGPRVALLSPLRTYGLVMVLVALFVFFSLILPGSFLTSRNIAVMASTQTVTLVLLVGLLLPLSTGDFDLSVASSMVLSATVTLLAINDWHIPGILAALMGIASAGVVGLINSYFIVAIGMNAFIITLAMMAIVTAINLGLSGQTILVVNQSDLASLINSHFGWFPVSVYYGWILAAVLWYVLERTPLGRYLRVTGIARTSARLAGVPTVRLRWFAFTGAALMAGVAGVILLETVGSVDPTTANQYLLDPYAAAFLGTAAFKLGWFNVGGSLIALYIVIVGETGLELLGYSSWIGQLFEGCALVLGLLLARLLSRSRQTIVGNFE
jgi:ribose transport system permease protein